MRRTENNNKTQSMSIDGISNPHTPTASSNGSTIAGQRNQAPSHSNDHGTTSTPTSSPSTTTLTSLPDQSEPNNTLSNSTKPMASTASSDNNQVSIITNTRTRRERPCDGCRRRKSRCVLNEDGVCVLCRFHKQDCTFVQSPQPRKRRIPADASNGSDNKRDRDREKRNIDRDGDGISDNGKDSKDRGVPLNSRKRSGRVESPNCLQRAASFRQRPSLTSTKSSTPPPHPATNPADGSSKSGRGGASAPTCSLSASSSNNSSNSSNSSTRRSRNPTAAPAVGKADDVDSAFDIDCKGGSLSQRTTLGLQHRRFSRYIGASAEFDEALIDLCTLNVSDEFPLPAHLVGSSFRRVYKDTTFLMRPEKVDTGQQHHSAHPHSAHHPLHGGMGGIGGLHADDEFDQELRDVDAVESLVSPHGQQLLNLYFRVVHPSFPILHKKLFLEKYQRTHREFAPCLLAAVYIIALNWWKHDPDLSQHSQPDLHKLEEIANRCMNDVISHPKLSTIQAGLLMLQRLGPAASSKSWALTAQLVAVGQELGLHLDCVEWRIPAWEKGLRKRLAWALFMQDKWGALTHGRPSHITSANWAVRQISPSDFPEITRDDKNEEEVQELESGRILFIEMIKLTQVTGEILDGFFTVDANRVLDGKISRVLERAKPIQIKLRDWYVKLPEVLKMDSGGTSRVKKLSSNGYLHLAYFATEITLHRQILRTLSPPLTSPLPATIPDQNLLHICRSAAKSRLISAMDFVNRLKPEHLRSFWYFASKVNFALIGTFGSLLWATSPTVQEAEFYKARLAEYRWTLRVSAKGADFMEFAVGVLDVGIGRVQQDEWRQRRGLTDTSGDPNASSSNISSDLSMLGLGMGAGLSTGDTNLTSMPGSNNSTGSGISPPPTIPVPPHMSPPATGDEMDQDDEGDDDGDDEDDDNHSYENGGHRGLRIAHGSDHDMDMDYSGNPRMRSYADGARGERRKEGDSEGSVSPFSHPQGLPSGYNQQQHQYQQHYQQYGQSQSWPQESGAGTAAAGSGAQ